MNAVVQQDSVSVCSILHHIYKIQSSKKQVKYLTL